MTINTNNTKKQNKTNDGGRRSTDKGFLYSHHPIAFKVIKVSNDVGMTDHVSTESHLGGFDKRVTYVRRSLNHRDPSNTTSMYLPYSPRVSRLTPTLSTQHPRRVHTDGGG